MSTLEAHIKSFNTKLQLLMKKYAALQKDNDTLRQSIEALKEKEKSYQASMDELRLKLSAAQAAGGQMSEDDKREFDRKITQYIKDIDKCITVLSE
jgi:cell division septum initiation protein DivIVA